VMQCQALKYLAGGAWRPSGLSKANLELIDRIGGRSS